MDDFDEEQIWQELELQNEAVLKYFQNAIHEVLSDQTLTLLSEEEEENEGEQAVTYDENVIKPLPRQKKKIAMEAEDGSEGDSEDDSDFDFDVDALEKQEKQKKENVRTGSKTRMNPSVVDDMFFKLSEMESFLEEMDKQEENEAEDDNVDYFQDLPSDEDNDLNLEQIISSKKKKKDTVWIFFQLTLCHDETIKGSLMYFLYIDR